MKINVLGTYNNIHQLPHSIVPNAHLPNVLLRTDRQVILYLNGLFSVRHPERLQCFLILVMSTFSSVTCLESLLLAVHPPHFYFFGSNSRIHYNIRTVIRFPIPSHFWPKAIGLHLKIYKPILLTTKHPNMMDNK